MVPRGTAVIGLFILYACSVPATLRTTLLLLLAAFAAHLLAFGAGWIWDDND